MIIDVTGIELTPGNWGKDCKGNGMCIDDNGDSIECCCDECDFMMCCFTCDWKERCKSCNHIDCPRKEK